MTRTMLRVVVQDQIGGKKTIVEVPDDVPLDRLLPALTRRLGLPQENMGVPIRYSFDHRRTGRRLEMQQTLRGAEVEPDDVLMLLNDMTAAFDSFVRQSRLESDYTKMTRLAEHSDFISIDTVTGDPPDQYLITFTCRGIERLTDSGYKPSEYHQVLIDLPLEYPAAPPRLRWITPIFHPNISPEGTKVCVNAWYPGRFLDSLCVMLGRMIQYQNYFPLEAYNGDAMLWALDHPDLFPVDSRPLIQGLADQPHSDSDEFSDDDPILRIDLLS